MRTVPCSVFHTQNIGQNCKFFLGGLMGLSTKLRTGKWGFHCILYGVCLAIQNQGVMLFFFLHLVVDVVDGAVQPLKWHVADR
jgi:hypothetical protein